MLRRQQLSGEPKKGIDVRKRKFIGELWAGLAVAADLMIVTAGLLAARRAVAQAQPWTPGVD
jgi:hypothetical protein